MEAMEAQDSKTQSDRESALDACFDLINLEVDSVKDEHKVMLRSFDTDALRDIVESIESKFGKDYDGRILLICFYYFYYGISVATKVATLANSKNDESR